MSKQIQADGPCNIAFSERDRSLLKDGDWPSLTGLDEEHWRVADDGSHLTRTLEFPELKSKVRVQGGTSLVSEAVFRFPNAPVYRTHSSRPHPYRIKDRWPNYHTMRVLTRSDRSLSSVPHVFLLHNGLNETRDIAFHYRLANWILAESPDAACIIRPLPAHLSRYPFQSPFAERPLDEYLLDPASVFRQFLRYMLETRWLLSTIAPRGDYEVLTGCDLLLNGASPGRDDSGALAKEITSQANRLLRASDEYAGHSRVPIEEGAVRQSVDGLRSLLGWTPIEERPGSTDLDRPAIHAVGYSMGGFIAQSVFCTWPFAVASCSNLFAGGALRDLAPTAFAHPEEWQSVLHGLRSELDEARVDGYFAAAPDAPDDPTEYVVGMEREVFDYFNRVFTDVFLQADRGSYSTRLAEFSRRLLFILGGDDPIVQTRNVLDAAPPGGITLHQIGDMSHFPGNRHGERAEKEQREFWLPEAGGMISRFSERAADLLQRSHEKWWGGARGSSEGTGETGESGSARLPDRALSNQLFEHELDRLVDMVEDRDKGWLFIARNQVPTVFLGEHAFDAHAAAMHHSEDLIGEYALSLQSRADRLLEAKDRFSLLVPATRVPGSTGDRFDDRSRFSKSEVAIRFQPDEDSSREMWKHFCSQWVADGVVRAVTAGEYEASELPEIGPAWAARHGAEQIPLTMLPDVWFAFDRGACEELLGVAPELGREAVEEGMVSLACDLAKRPKIEAGVRNKARLLEEQRTVGAVRVIRVSAAELNPRYRGRLLDQPGDDVSREVQHLLIYWAVAYQASKEYQAP